MKRLIGGLLCACALAGPGFASESEGIVFLGTTHPGPYFLLVEADADSAGQELWCSGLDPQTLPVGPGWHAYQLADDRVPPFELKVTRPGHGTLPRVRLHALGDDVRLVTRGDGLVADATSAPAPTPAAAMELRGALPPIPAEAWRMSIRMDDAAQWDGHGEIVLGGATSTWSQADAAGRRESFLVAPSPATEVVCRATGRPFGAPLELTLTPLFTSTPGRALQAGIYFIRSCDATGGISGTVARFLEAGTKAAITGRDRYVGGAFRFLPLTDRIISRLTPDGIFAFEGFHERESSRTADPAFRRWTAGPQAVMRIAVPPGLGAELTLQLNTDPSVVQRSEIALEVDGRNVPLAFRDGICRSAVAVSPQATADGEVAVALKARTWVPAKALLSSKDQRTLGVAVEELAIRFRAAEDGRTPGPSGAPGTAARPGPPAT